MCIFVYCKYTDDEQIWEKPCNAALMQEWLVSYKHFSAQGAPCDLVSFQFLGCWDDRILQTSYSCLFQSVSLPASSFRLPSQRDFQTSRLAAFFPPNSRILDLGCGDAEAWHWELTGQGSGRLPQDLVVGCPMKNVQGWWGWCLFSRAAAFSFDANTRKVKICESQCDGCVRYLSRCCAKQLWKVFAGKIAICHHVWLLLTRLTYSIVAAKWLVAGNTKPFLQTSLATFALHLFL